MANKNVTQGFIPNKKNQLTIKIGDVDPTTGTVEVHTSCDEQMTPGQSPTTPAEEIGMAVLWFIQDYMAEAKEREGAGIVVDTDDFQHLFDLTGGVRTKGA